MKFINAIVAGVIITAAQFAVPAYAQSTSGAVVAACKTGAGCAAAVRAYVAALKSQGLSLAQVDTAIADLTTSLGQEVVSGGLTSNVISDISAGIRTAAAEVSDPTQAQETRQVASAVQSVSAGGSTDEVVTADGAGGISGSGQ